MTEIMKLKVCGMKYQDNITEIAALQPDYLGFIFHEDSPRNFKTSIPELLQSIKKVGVFVNKDIDFILEKVRTYQLNAVQLHGEESPEMCKQIKRQYEACQFERSREQNDVVIPSKEKPRNDDTFLLIKVFSIKDKFDFDILKPYEKVCDFFLFDTKGELPGGNGYTFNWNVLKDYKSSKPFFLSGGIGLDQIKNLKEFQKSDASRYCYAIDVNSRFEIDAGLKNIEKLKEFKKQLSF